MNENPNPSGWISEEGTVFFSLPDIMYLGWDSEKEEEEESGGLIQMRGETEHSGLNISRSEFDSLMNALRIYHSKR